MISKSLGHAFFKICKYISVNSWNQDKQKIGLAFSKIFKYTFCKIGKKWSAKNWGRVFLRFVSILFLTFEKVDHQKIGTGFF